MSLLFFAVAGFTLGRGVRVDEDESAAPVVANFDKLAAAGDPVADTPYKYPCTTNTTTTTTCTGADCVDKFWPWSKEATIGGTTINPPKSASLLEENEHGIGGDIVGDIERLGHDVEYEATHLSGPGTGHPTATAAPVARRQHSSEKHVIAKHPGGKGKHGDTSAEALIDEILDGEDAGSTTTSPGATTAAETTVASGTGTTESGATGTTTGSATGTASTTAGAAEALLQKATSTTPAVSTVKSTAPCPATYGDDLDSLRKRLDGLSCN